MEDTTEIIAERPLFGYGLYQGAEVLNYRTPSGVLTIDTFILGITLDIGIDIVEKVLSEIDKIQGILNHKPILLQTDKVKLKNNIFKKLI